MTHWARASQFDPATTPTNSASIRNTRSAERLRRDMHCLLLRKPRPFWLVAKIISLDAMPHVKVTRRETCRQGRVDVNIQFSQCSEISLARGRDSVTSSRKPDATIQSVDAT